MNGWWTYFRIFYKIWLIIFLCLSHKIMPHRFCFNLLIMLTRADLKDDACIWTGAMELAGTWAQCSLQSSDFTNLSLNILFKLLAINKLTTLNFDKNFSSRLKSSLFYQRKRVHVLISVVYIGWLVIIYLLPLYMLEETK